MMNRLANCGNKYQGDAKRVLCVCSAGLLRSPTTAVILQQEYGYNTRAAGLESSFALIPVDEVLLTWADQIVCMNNEQKRELDGWTRRLGLEKTVIALNIPDNFKYMDPTLIELIKAAYPKPPAA